jgi:hypothetical protein
MSAKHTDRENTLFMWHVLHRVLICSYRLCSLHSVVWIIGICSFSGIAFKYFHITGKLWHAFHIRWLELAGYQCSDVRNYNHFVSDNPCFIPEYWNKLGVSFEPTIAFIASIGIFIKVLFFLLFETGFICKFLVTDMIRIGIYYKVATRLLSIFRITFSALSLNRVSHLLLNLNHKTI